MGALAPRSPLHRHSKRSEKAPDDKEIVEEAAKRLEVYVQKAVRTELESEVRARFVFHPAPRIPRLASRTSHTAPRIPHTARFAH